MIREAGPRIENQGTAIRHLWKEDILEKSEHCPYEEVCVRGGQYIGTQTHVQRDLALLSSPKSDAYLRAMHVATTLMLQHAPWSRNQECMYAS